VSFKAALAAASSRPLDPATLDALAKAALAQGEEETALPLFERAVEKAPTSRTWQWKGLLERSIDEHQRALDSLAEAARLAPADAGIAHGLARVAMEAGLDARQLYQHARALAPLNGQLLIGLAAAMAAAGQGDQAVAELQQGIEGSPLWREGYEHLAQLLATLGRADEATEAVENSLARHPSAVPLWETLLGIQLRRGAFASLNEILDRAEAAGVKHPGFLTFRGIQAAECDSEPFPAALFGSVPAEIEAALGRWRIRHLLRVGAVDAALPLIDKELDRDTSGEIWSYASTAWRLAGDPRSAWLEGDPRLVSMADIIDLLPPIEKLAETLRGLHNAKGEYLDQSVRGGTQTDGPLFSRIDPVIRQLRRAIVTAVEQHVAQLPAVDPGHPTLRQPRDRKVRFSGSWSVRLRSGGRHSNHVHPQGWISSALYVALPPKLAGAPADAGWLTLGTPDEKLGIDLAPHRKIEPKIGHLALFPSCMWHGTIPFDDGERLTVAFDVAPPK
jgi:tetratricopeptide (TPR) repeat protein